MGVALHSNVGLMHAAMPVYNAWCDRVLMLIIGATGPVDTYQRRPSGASCDTRCRALRSTDPVDPQVVQPIA
ncbi:hypothetical protein [Sinorhizobium fredii]|uniref:hypothetical protein n=1 Tax=Rhizobium fredii TaxID=380 RepID=UPI0030A891F7